MKLTQEGLDEHCPGPGVVASEPAVAGVALKSLCSPSKKRPFDDIALPENPAAEENPGPERTRFVAVPDRDFIELHVSPWNNHMYLVHKLTGECQRLPESDEFEYKMFHNGDNFTYVVMEDGSSKWAGKLLQWRCTVKVVGDENPDVSMNPEKVFVQHKSQDQQQWNDEISLLEMVTNVKYHDHPISIPGTSKQITFKVAVLHRPRSVSVVYFSWKHVYEACGLKMSEGHSWKWIQALVPRWYEHCSKLCGPEGKHQFLRAQETRASKKMKRLPENGSGEEPHMRFLEFHGASTSFFVFSMTKMVFGPDARHGRCQSEEDVVRLKPALCWLLRNIVRVFKSSNQKTIWLFLSGFSWPSPGFPTGAHKVKIPVNGDGEIDAEEFAAALEQRSSPDMRKDSIDVRNEIRCAQLQFWSLERLAMLLAKHCKLHVLLFQMFINFSATYDRQMRAEVWDVRQMVPERVEDRITSASPAARSLFGPYAKKLLVTRYHAARKAHFSRSCQLHFNVSVDAARRGAVQRMYGFVSDSENCAAWLNPTVCSERSKVTNDVLYYFGLVVVYFPHKEEIYHQQNHHYDGFAHVFGR